MPGPVQLRPGDLLVVGYAVVSQAELHVWHPTAPLLPRLLLLAGVLALLARDRWPRAVPLLCAAGGQVWGLWVSGTGTGIGIVTAGIAVALLGRQGRAGVPGLLVVIAPVPLLELVSSEQRSDIVTAPLLLLAVAAVAAGLSRAGREVDAVRQRIAEVQAAGQVERDGLLSEERRRLARELHDVVSHHLTVAALQASGARVQLQSTGDTRAVLDALTAAEQAGRAALADLRPLLDVVGGDGALAPQPGLADVPDLLRTMREAGLDLRTDGLEHTVRPLPAGQDLVAYRVLQEALTNAVRHGHGTVDLRLSVHAGLLRIDVVNAVAPGARRRVGHGLVGMAERLALYGGRLEARRRGGLWTLRAELPVLVTEAVPA